MIPLDTLFILMVGCNSDETLRKAAHTTHRAYEWSSLHIVQLFTVRHTQLAFESVAFPDSIDLNERRVANIFQHRLHDLWLRKAVG